MAETRPPSNDTIKRLQVDVREHGDWIAGQKALAAPDHEWRTGVNRQMSRLEDRMSKMTTAIAVSAVKQGLVTAAVAIVCSGVASGLIAWVFRGSG